MATPEEKVAELDACLQRQQRTLRHLDAYLRGKQPLRFLALELREEFGERLSEVVINWPELITGAYGDRLTNTGFRLPDSTSDGVEIDKRDADLWKIWQDNGLEKRAPMAHTEVLGLGRAYVMIGSRPQPDDAADGDADQVFGAFDLPADTDSPLITVEHPFQVYAEIDPRWRQPSAAIKRWKDVDKVSRASLYLPNATHHFKWARRWVEVDKDEHNLGVVPVVPLVNRERILDQDGRSEFESVIPIADAANKMATDMMVSGEFHGMPRRWALGFSQADFVDQDGAPVSPFEQIAGRIWATRKKPGEAEVGTFTETDLAVFHNSIKLLAQVAAQLAALPPHYMQFTGENPASADAIRSSEAGLVRRVEQKQGALGDDWRRVMAIAVRIRDGEGWNRDYGRATTTWRNAATPTRAQESDAAVKLYQADIITWRQTVIDMGYSPQEIARMQKEREEEQERKARLDPVGALGRRFGQDPPPDPDPNADPNADPTTE